MSAARDKLEKQATRLRDQIAKAEGELSGLKSRLAKIEAKLTGEPPPQTGLDMLWEAALPNARIRSSKRQCRTEWMRIPIAERPPVREVVAALRAWNRCDEWRKDSNAFVPGLHRWIKNRQWENLPQNARPSTSKPKPRPAPKPPQDPATLEDLNRILGPITRRSTNSPNAEPTHPADNA